MIGLIGSAYALLGGLRSTAFSDMLYGIVLLAGGFLITILGLKLFGGDAGILGGLETLSTEIPDRLNSIGGAKAPVPFWNIFTGVLINNVFYWCTNQQIIQRTLAASNLAEGQKGVLLTGLLKLLGPLYLVLPGIMAYYNPRFRKSKSKNLIFSKIPLPRRKSYRGRVGIPGRCFYSNGTTASAEAGVATTSVLCDSTEKSAKNA